MRKHPSIEKVETILVDLPTIRPHELSMTTMRGQTLLIVRLVAPDGVVGLGEGTTIGGLAYGDESPEGMKLAIDSYIAPVLERCDPDRIGSTMAAIGRVVRGNHFAKCAVETALIDAFAKRRGLPVGDLFGGLFRDRLPIVWTLASGDTARDIDEAQEMLDRRRHSREVCSPRRGSPPSPTQPASASMAAQCSKARLQQSPRRTSSPRFPSSSGEPSSLARCC